MRASLLKLTAPMWIALAGFPGPAGAQSPLPPPANPLEQLMMSQPEVDISSPVTAAASFDPPVVRPGEKSVYRVTFNAIEASIRWPEQLSAPAQLTLRPSARGQILLPSAGELRPFTSFNYHAQAAAPGVFTIPAFTVEVYGKPVVIPEARLEARPDLAGTPESARQIELEPSATNVFVGQSLNVRVLLPASASNILQTLAQVQLNGDGFLADKDTVRQSVETLDWHGGKRATYIYETSVTPIAAGQVTLSAQGFAGGREFTGMLVIHGPATLPGGMPRYVLLDSDPITLNVRPLPSDGQLPGFTGAIGSYTCDPPQLETSTLRVGDPVQLAVIIRGQGDLGRLVPPPPPPSQDWQVFPPTAGGIVRTADRREEGARFIYTLIPLSDGVRTTPAIPFSCFDPGRAAYVDLTVHPVPVTVMETGMAANLEPLPGLADQESAPEKQAALSRLAPSPGWTASSLVPLQLRGWFPLVQVIPALAFSALWLWDRRRRHLERHPEISRRHQARRELRRQKRRLRRAAATGDAAGYTRCAVRALQIVCAPHVAADPRALVCGDVLGRLTATERQGRAGEVARRFFAAADASSFAVSPPGDAGLLALLPELDEILLELEERL